MGVHGLWQLLGSTGKPVPLESLEGKVLAVDVSVWLHQLSKGMRDAQGNPLPNAHLHGLFTRICKLLFYRIKPVFVFDGAAPAIKKQTLASRRDKREDAERTSSLMQQKILTNLIRSQALKDAYGVESIPILPPPGKSSTKGGKDAMFELAPLPETSKRYLSQESTVDQVYADRLEVQQMVEYQRFQCYTDSFKYSFFPRVIPLWNALDQGTNEYESVEHIDVDTDDFTSLPAEIQHEIIRDIRLSRKNYNLSKIVELPEDSKDFSNFQMAKLVKHNRLNLRLDQLRKELNDQQTRAVTKQYKGNLGHMDDIYSQRLVSEDSSHYILAKRNLQKKKGANKNGNRGIILEESPTSIASSYVDMIVESDEESNGDSVIEVEMDEYLNSEKGAEMGEYLSSTKGARKNGGSGTDELQMAIEESLKEQQSKNLEISDYHKQVSDRTNSIEVRSDEQNFEGDRRGMDNNVIDLVDDGKPRFRPVIEIESGSESESVDDDVEFVGEKFRHAQDEGGIDAELESVDDDVEFVSEKFRPALKEGGVGAIDDVEFVGERFRHAQGGNEIDGAVDDDVYFIGEKFTHTQGGNNRNYVSAAADDGGVNLQHDHELQMAIEESLKDQRNVSKTEENDAVKTTCRPYQQSKNREKSDCHKHMKQINDKMPSISESDEMKTKSSLPSAGSNSDVTSVIKSSQSTKRTVKVCPIVKEYKNTKPLAVLAKPAETYSIKSAISENETSSTKYPKAYNRDISTVRDKNTIIDKTGRKMNSGDNKKEIARIKAEGSGKNRNEIGRSKVKDRSSIFKRKISCMSNESGESVDSGEVEEKRVKVVISSDEEDAGVCGEVVEVTGHQVVDVECESDSDSDDFIEVKVDLSKVREDDLFPASMFTTESDGDTLTLGEPTVKVAKTGAKGQIINSDEDVVTIIDDNQQVEVFGKQQLSGSDDANNRPEAVVDVADTHSKKFDERDITVHPVTSPARSNDAQNRRVRVIESQHSICSTTATEDSDVIDSDVMSEVSAGSFRDAPGKHRNSTDSTMSELDSTSQDSHCLPDGTEESTNKGTRKDASGIPPSPVIPNLQRQFESLNENSVRALRDNLATDNYKLRQDQGKQERMSVAVGDQMYAEAQELLQLFGIPYIVSPTEAEAQCAFLEQSKLTHGTITDDSDIWLFGGKCVFKNFFNQAKHVECFRDVHITSQLGLLRESLINVALLCGSDYTEGIRGVGPVIAMEILAEFPGDSLDGLAKFKTWWDTAQNQLKVPINESKLKSKLRELDIRSDFPNAAVVDAYLKPTVDESKEKFTWSLPDLEQLRQFATTKLGWDRQKVDESLLPVLKRLAEKQTQRSINSFFQPEVYMQAPKMKSKRLQTVVQKIMNPQPPKPDTIGVSSGTETASSTKKTDTKTKAKTKTVGEGKDKMTKTDEQTKAKTKTVGGEIKDKAKTDDKMKDKPTAISRDKDKSDEKTTSDTVGKGTKRKGKEEVKSDTVGKRRKGNDLDISKGRASEETASDIVGRNKIGLKARTSKDNDKKRVDKSDKKIVNDHTAKTQPAESFDSSTSTDSSSDSDTSSSSNSDLEILDKCSDDEIEVVKNVLDIQEILGLKIGDGIDDYKRDDIADGDNGSDAELNDTTAKTDQIKGRDRVFESTINVEELLQLDEGSFEHDAEFDDDGIMPDEAILDSDPDDGMAAEAIKDGDEGFKGDEMKGMEMNDDDKVKDKDRVTLGLVEERIGGIMVKTENEKQRISENVDSDIADTVIDISDTDIVDELKKKDKVDYSMEGGFIRDDNDDDNDIDEDSGLVSEKANTEPAVQQTRSLRNKNKGNIKGNNKGGDLAEVSKAVLVKTEANLVQIEANLAKTGKTTHGKQDTDNTDCNSMVNQKPDSQASVKLVAKINPFTAGENSDMETVTTNASNEAAKPIKSEPPKQSKPSTKIKAASIYANDPINPVVKGVPWADRGGRGRRKGQSGRSKAKNTKTPTEIVVKQTTKSAYFDKKKTIGAVNLSESDSD